MHPTLFWLSLFCFTQVGANAQKLIIGFYNCENLYDTIHQRKVLDEEFLPGSNKQYGKVTFETKAKHIAQNIYALGKLENGNGAAIIGLVEIENRNVIEQLVSDPLLVKYHYQIIHFESPDPRGIDVALLYSPQHFTPYQYKPISLAQGLHEKDYPTRDILYVKGLLENKWVHVFVNHWPSRRGGQAYSENRRIWASEVLRHAIDSIQNLDKVAPIIVMGDFNDNPTDKSLKNLPMHNPFIEMFLRGEGSLAFGDSWHLFDQILISKNLTNTNFDLIYYKSIVYKNKSLIETRGRYRGYPKRSWNGDQFNNGYSDHFPVSLILSLKSVQNPVK